MVRFNDKTIVSTLAGNDILPMTPLSDTSDDKKVTINMLSQYTVDNISTLSSGKTLTTNDLTNALKTNYDTAYTGSLEGIPLYSATNTYQSGYLTKTQVGTSQPKLWYSLTNNNIGNNPVLDTGTNWQEINLDNTYRPDLFDVKWSDHLLDNLSWLRADTFSWQDGTIYSAGYNKLKDEYENASSTVEEDIAGSNCTVVGTPTISRDYIASSFSLTSYLTAPTLSTSATDTWELKTKIKATTITTTQHMINMSEKNAYSVMLSIVSSKLTLYVSSNGTSWNIASAVAGSTLTADQWYYIKLGWDGTAYYVQYSTDNETWTTDISVTSSTSAYGLGQNPSFGSGWTSGPLLSSIDLKETSISSNSTTLWRALNYIEYKRTPKGYKIADSTQETAILNKYTSDGIAWYYILDTENKQFKLPRTKFGFEGLRDTVGDDIDESLPNVKGGRFWTKIGSGTTGGGIVVEESTQTYSGTSSQSAKQCSFSVDLSTASSTYQDNAPVQERATQMYLYFYVGEYAQTAIQQTAGLNSELFNGKLDLSGTTNATSVDGQWVQSAYTVFEGTTFAANASVTYDINSYLPNDGYNYEVFVSCYARTGSTSGNSCGSFLSTSLITGTDAIRLGRAITRTASYASYAGCSIVPVGTDRKITYINGDSNGTSGNCGLYLKAYRRIGTNS